MAHIRALTGRHVRLTGGFWGRWYARLRQTVLPYQWAVLTDRAPGVEPSHALSNLRVAAGERSGEYLGRYHHDTDLAKWLEAAAYALERDADAALAENAERLIDLVAQSQWSDGYLNSRYSVDRSKERWTNERDDHELYIAGHWLEALVAYHRATGSERALGIARRLGDHLDSVFGPGPSQLRGYPGHPETELALVRLWRATGDGRYLRLARFFVYERGTEPSYFAEEARRRGDDRPYKAAYSLSHRPLVEQDTAVGHAVRAMYLYAGATDIAMAEPEPQLRETLLRLWADVTTRQMYVTGGVGAEGYLESFTLGYDLPSDRAYAETCAAIGLVFWAHRMLQMEGDGRYADVLERVLFNGALSGVGLDGTHYFYVNPLEVWPAAAAERFDLRDVHLVRQTWFECACCPPNLARLLASIPDYLYGVDETGTELFVHQFAASEAEVAVAAAGTVRLCQQGDYPWAGHIDIALTTERKAEWTLSLRLPGWARGAVVRVNGEALDVGPLASLGYLRIRRAWQSGDRVELDFPMPIERVRSHPRVWSLAGTAALQRGPVVYCLEEADNGPGLAGLRLLPTHEWQPRWEKDLLGGVVTLSGPGERLLPPADVALYTTHPLAREATRLKAVPYWAWCNRGAGEMRVWLTEA